MFSEIKRILDLYEAGLYSLVDLEGHLAAHVLARKFELGLKREDVSS